MYPRSTKTKHRRSPPYISKTSEDSSKPSQTSNDASSSWRTSNSQSSSTSSRQSSTYKSSIPGLSSKSKGSSVRPRGQSVPATARESGRDTKSTHENGNLPAMDLAVNGNMASSEKEATQKTEDKLNDSIRSVPESNVMTYRSVRSMKHKNDRSYQEGLRKSNSLQDLTAGAKEDESHLEDGLYRSHSRESLYDSYPKRRAVSLNFGESIVADSANEDPEDRPKTFFESLRESLLNPEPPKPKPKNSRYLKLASIPNTKPIEDYVGQNTEHSPPRRRKTLDPAELSRIPRPGSVRWNTRDNKAVSNTPKSNEQAIAPNAKAFDGVAKNKESSTVTPSASRLPVHASKPSPSMHVRSRSLPVSSSSSSQGNSDSSSLPIRPSPSGFKTPGKKIQAKKPGVDTVQSSLHATRPSSGVHKKEVSGAVAVSSAPPSSSSNSTTPSNRFTPWRSKSSNVSSSSVSSSSSSTSKPSHPSTSNLRPLGASIKQEKKETRSMSAPVDPRKLVNGDVSARSQSPSRSVDRERERRESSPYASRTQATSYLVNHRNKNMTDEHKMAKSSGARIGTQLRTESHSPARTTRSEQYDDLMYMKKGWLLRQDEISQEWTKHWFVLSGTSLKYFKDSKAEDANQTDGVIDISVGYEINEIKVSRNYGFKLKTDWGNHTLSAMTSGIRNNWMLAIQKCMEMSGRGAGSDIGATGVDKKSSETRVTASGRVSRKDSSGLHPKYQNSIDLGWQSSRSPGTGTSLSSRWESKPTSVDTRSTSRDRLEPPTFTPKKAGSSSPEQDRTRSPSPSKNRKMSCTWPYDSPPASDTSSEQGSVTLRSRDNSRNSSNVSDVSAYLDDEERRNTPRELSPEEEKELDNVEKNIRRIHRKSISDLVQQHKPQHFEKFESGSAFKSGDETPPVRSREASRDRETASTPIKKDLAESSRSPLSIRDRSRSARAESPISNFRERTFGSPSRLTSSTPRRHGAEVERAKSPMTSRAPSAKVKEKSRSKSPRPKSPPPQAVDLDHVELNYFDHNYARRGRSGEQNQLSDIERKWKEVETGSHNGVESEGSSVGAADAALVDLLETEVESLKSRLEHTETELQVVNHDNLELRNQLRSSHRDHRHSMDDIEADQSRYIIQIEEMQTQMEKTTGQLQRRLEEAQEQSDVSHLQLQSLKKQLTDYEVRVDSQKKENAILKDKLSNSASQLTSTQSNLQQTCSEMAAERDQLQQVSSDLELRIRELEREVNRLLTVIQDKEREIGMKEETVSVLQKQLDKSSKKLETVQTKSGDVVRLEKELQEKSQRMASLNQEFVLTKRLLREKEQELKENEEDSEQQLQEVEAEFTKEKEELQAQIAQLQRRLEQVLKQSNISDSLNTSMADILREKDETIAQLEEKLIENDKKIEDLSEELAMEIEENTTLQQNLDHTYDENARLKRDLDLARKEVKKITASMEQHKVDVLKLKQHAEERDAENTQLRKDLSRDEAEMHELERENQKLKTVVKKYQEQADQVTREAGEMMDNHQALQEQLEHLDSQNADLTAECQKLTGELEAASSQIKDYQDRLVKQKQQFESDLGQRYQELTSTKNLVSSLQGKLTETEIMAKESAEALKASVPQSSSKHSPELEREHLEMQGKYDKLFSEVKRLRKELKEAYAKVDDLELTCATHQQQFKSVETDYQDQLNLMTNRVQDLTNKLSVSERKVRKLERKTSKRKRTREEKNLVLNDVSQGKGLTAQSSELLESAEQENGISIDVPEQTSSGGDDEQYDSDGGSLSDPEIASRLKQLQQEYLVSEEKVKELKDRLMVQQAAQVDLHMAHHAEKTLREQNQLYEEQLNYLQHKMQSIQSDQASVGSLGELDMKSSQFQIVIQDFRQKLSDVVQELGTFGVIPTKDVYTATIENIRDRLKAILKESDDGPQKLGLGSQLNLKGIVPEEELDLDSKLTRSQCIRLYAEKLSLEATVVGEMAYLVKTSQDCIMSERELYLHQIQEANNAILDLERKVQTLQLDKSETCTLQPKATDSLFTYSSLLADKMLLQAQLSSLIGKHNKERLQVSETPQVSRDSDSSAKKLAQEALFLGKLDKQLFKEPSDASQQGMPSSSASLATRALVQGELAFVLNKLKERMTESKSDQERIDILEQELAVAQHHLEERSQNMQEVVVAFQTSQLQQLVGLINQGQIGESQEKQVASQKLGRELLHAEMTLAVKKFAEQYESRLLSVEGASEEDSCRKHLLIEGAVQQELDHSLQIFDRCCQNDRVQQQSMDTSVDKDSDKMDLMMKLSDIIAQKAVISGQTQFIQEQLSRQHQGDGAERTPTRLRRNDSGIMVHSGSLPTSPTEPSNHSIITASTLDNLVENLNSDAATREEIAAYLKEHSVSMSGSSEGIHAQIARIAANLAQVDVSLGHRRRAIQDYAEVISREAIFQAQMVYIINQLRLEHEQQIATIQHQIEQERQNSGTTGHTPQYIQELEVEVERLGALIAENDNLLHDESSHAQQQLVELQAELERREVDFQHDINDMENKYKNKLESLRHDLEDARGEVDRLQQSEHEKISMYEGRAAEMEEEIQATHDEMDRVSQEKQDITSRYESHIETLEAEIHSMKSSHQRELEQAKMDMKTAMKALHDSRSQGTERLEDEVKILKTKLDEERSKYVAELEKLRLELKSDSKQAAQALLSNKIEQLEMAMQNMQADYEQELTTQKTAHRRELARSKDEMLQLLADAEAKSIHVDEGIIRKKYVKDIDRIKEIYDRGFAAMEKSHQRVLMDMRRAHKTELELLRQEKDLLLDEETKATQAALDAMKKAHDAELQKERNKFLDAIAKTYSNSDVESLQRQHEDDLELIQTEIKQLSEQYSIKCLENAALEERLESQTKSLQQSRRRNHDLMARNEELNLRIQQEIGKLNKFVTTKTCPMSPMKREKEPPEVYDLKVALRVKDVEVQQLQDEIGSLKDQLQGTTEELEDSLERLQELQEQQQASHDSHQREITEVRSRLELQCEASSPVPSGNVLIEEKEPTEVNMLSTISRDSKPKVVSTLSNPESGCNSSAAPGRALPKVPSEARTMKKMLWRQRHPERAHTSPGPVTPGLATFSVNVEEGATGGISPKTRRRAVGNNSPEPRRRLDRHNTTVGFDVAEENKF